MSDLIITNVEITQDVTLVTVNNVPNTAVALAGMFKVLADEQINIDMISQTAPYKEKVNISFTAVGESDKLIRCLVSFKEMFGDISTDINAGNAKIILYGEGMRENFGVAAKVFELFAKEDVQIKLITTSEVEISCLIDRKDVIKVEGLFM